MEFLAGLVQPFQVPAIHHKHHSSCVGIVMPPVGPHLFLAPDVPHNQCRAAPVRLQCLHIETHSGHCHHTLVVLQLVKQRGLSWSIQAQHQDLCLFLILGSVNTHVLRMQSVSVELSLFVQLCKLRWVHSVCLLSYEERVIPPLCCVQIPSGLA